jgi:hypothetical protein
VAIYAYPQELRDRVLRALERGEGPTAIAKRLEVSRGWVYQVQGRFESEGKRCSLPRGDISAVAGGALGIAVAGLDQSGAGFDVGAAVQAVGEAGCEHPSSGVMASTRQVGLVP